jgi:hypothetical protein
MDHRKMVVVVVMMKMMKIGEMIYHLLLLNLILKSKA